MRDNGTLQHIVDAGMELDAAIISEPVSRFESLRRNIHETVRRNFSIGRLHSMKGQ